MMKKTMILELSKFVRKVVRFIVLGVVIFALGACTSLKIPALSKLSESEAKQQVQTKVKDPSPTVVRVSGYSTYKVGKKGVKPEARLKALRASKLDGYRALAERIYGVAIAGSSSVAGHSLKSDGVKTMVDSVVRGARVVSISESKDGLVETILEVTLEGAFKHCLSAVNQFKSEGDCRLPLPSMDAMNASGVDHGMATQQQYYIN